MKTFLLLFLPMLASWCQPPGQTQASAKPLDAEVTDTVPHPVQKADNIRFLQKVGGKLIYVNEYWSGPLISLTFHDSKTGQLLNTVNVRDRNPYLDIGFSIEHYDGEELNDAIFLHSDKAPDKSKMKAYLPQYLYDEIPSDWRFSGGITMCMPTGNWEKAERYIPIYYLMEWGPHPEKQFLGNYGVTMVTVLDSTGTEVYRQQFDGLLSEVVVSDNGKYLGIAYTIYPEESQAPDTRLRNCVKLIYIPENKIILTDETSNPSENFYFSNYPVNTMVMTKVNEYDDDSNWLVVETLTGELYTAILPDRKKVSAITRIADGIVHYRTRTVKDEQTMTLHRKFNSKN